MIPVDDALARLDAITTPLGRDNIPTVDAIGRVIATAVTTPTPLPIFDQSAVDGYAVRYADIATIPATLPLRGVVAAAGQTEQPVLAPGDAMRIFTGGMVPVGADTIVRQEVTTSDGGAVTVVEPVALGVDLRRAGEEMPAGTRVVDAGTVVTPGVLGALAFIGAARVEAVRTPRISVFATGDEIVPLGDPLGLGEVPDANLPLVMAHLQAWATPARAGGHLRDDRAVVKATLDEAFATSDLIITTGGVSVGDFDFVPAVSEELGAERVFWKVAQKPGMPLYVARRDNCTLIGLPGNPGAVMINLHVYVRRIIDRMLGLDPAARWHSAAAPGNPRREDAKVFWLRANAEMVGDRMVLRELGHQSSHMLTNLAHANALVRLPSRDEAPDYATVAWTPLG